MNLGILRGPSVLFTAALMVAACEGAQPLDPIADSEGVSVSAARSAAQLDAPSNASAAASSTSRIDVAWQDNSSNDTNIQVHRSTAGAAGAFSVLATLGANATSHRDSGLVAGAEYCYRLRSVRSTGSKTSYSPFSNTACATTQAPPPPPPPPPAAPTVTDATPYNSGTVLVSFIDNSNDEDGFRVYRSFDGAATWTMWAIASRNAVGVYNHFLQSEQNVCYRMTAFNAGGESPVSSHACTTPPAAPSYVSARVVEGSTFELSWSDNSAVEDGYEVRHTYRVNVDGFPCGGDPMNADCVTIEEVVAVIGAGTTSHRLTAYISASEAGNYLVYTRSDGGYSYGTPATLEY